MWKTNHVAGLKPRIEAAFHLNAVLGGKPFSPITADRIADPRDRALANRLVTIALRRHGQITALIGRSGSLFATVSANSFQPAAALSSDKRGSTTIQPVLPRMIVITDRS